MVTQGRAGVVDTVPESSHLLHWNCIYSSIYMCAQNHANEKKRERKRKYKYCIYYHTYTQSGTLGTCQEGENVRGLVETPLFIHVYTGGCQIYSQLAISETPSLTYYLQYMRILWHRICSCEVLSTPHSHSYIFDDMLCSWGQPVLRLVDVNLDVGWDLMRWCPHNWL